MSTKTGKKRCNVSFIHRKHSCTIKVRTIMLSKLIDMVKKKPEENVRVNSEEKRFLPPNVTWLHSWSVNETRDALSQSFFNHLPNEIILHIFQYLSVRDLCTVSLVCRTFKILADEDQLWKVKVHSKFHHLMLSMSNLLR